MSDRGAIYDLGYTPYEGEKLGRRGAIATTYRDGDYRVLGIKRRARKKILPWSLAALVVVPAVVFVGLAFLLSSFAPEVESPYGGHADYFNLTGTIVLLFCALAAPELLIPDRKEGVLSIYSSRPLLPDDYVGARFASLLTVVAGFMLIPQALMYIGFAALDADGFFTALWSNGGDIPRILASTAVYAIAYAPLALLIAAFANRKAAATGVYLGALLMGTVLSAALIEATSLTGRRYAAMLAVGELPTQVNDWIWGSAGTSPMAEAGFDPWVSLVVIVAVAVVATGIVVSRYRRLM
jgi:ABC-2 type transport system permease protein